MRWNRRFTPSVKHRTSNMYLIKWLVNMYKRVFVVKGEILVKKNGKIKYKRKQSIERKLSLYNPETF